MTKTVKQNTKRLQIDKEETKRDVSEEPTPKD